MKKNNKPARMLAFLTVLMIAAILAGCGTTATVVVPPTQDIPAVRTEAAATVVSKLTIEAALNPSATPAAPQVITATAAPTQDAAFTATAAPTEPAAAAPTATAAVVVQATVTTAPVTGGGSSGGGSGATAIPTATRRPGPDQATYVGQEPNDGTTFRPGAQFDVKYTFKNIGTSTWTTDYDLRFDRGANLAEGKPATIPFPQSVAPGQTVTLIFDAVAPPDSGRYTSYMSLINENGDVFAQFYLIINVQ